MTAEAPTASAPVRVNPALMDYCPGCLGRGYFDLQRPDSSGVRSVICRECGGSGYSGHRFERITCEFSDPFCFGRMSG